MWVIANVGERRICRLKSVNLILPKSKLYACHVICTVITVHFFFKDAFAHFNYANTEYS